MMTRAETINERLFGIPFFVQRYVIRQLEKLSWAPLFLMRAWLAQAFWSSGMTKIANWETTVALFADEYKVPVLSPEAAAWMATAGELTLPVLLFFGFMSRFAALGILVMTAVIEFTYLSFPIHKAWALVALLLVCHGPGVLSIDHFVRKLCTPKA